MERTRKGFRRWGVIALGALLAACGDEQQATNAAAGSANRAPTIRGTPATSVIQNSAYSFTPVASDPDGDRLIFGIDALPAWAKFDTSTGQLSGTPSAASVGTSRGVVVWVSDGEVRAQLPAFDLTVVGTSSANRAPVISGTAPPAVVQGGAYVFNPTASDPDGNALTFSIVNKPAWATFDTSTGRLQGTPGAGDLGATAGIVISVSDGSLSASLAAFSVVVQAFATGSVTLSWSAPTQNTDGSPLIDLAGFKIYWGTSNGSYPNSVTLNNPGLTTYVVENLVPGTYFFAASALNSAGIESTFSGAVSRTVQ